MRAASTRSRRPLVVACVLALVAASCSHYGRGAPVLSDDVACARVDSVLRDGTLAAGVGMTGRVTIDVEQYRVRGRFTLSLTPQGDLAFEITSTTMLGGHREDAVLSFYADTLRVLDREGGNYYEGADVDALVADGLGRPIDLAELLRRVTTRPPDCRRLSEVSVAERDGGARIRGRVDGADFELDFSGPRVDRAVWPLPRPDRRARDTLEARYEWRGGRLSGLVLFVPERRWRIKLLAD